MVESDYSVSSISIRDKERLSNLKVERAQKRDREHYIEISKKC